MLLLFVVHCCRGDGSGRAGIRLDTHAVKLTFLKLKRTLQQLRDICRVDKIEISAKEARSGAPWTKARACTPKYVTARRCGASTCCREQGETAANVKGLPVLGED